MPSPFHRKKVVFSIWSLKIPRPPHISLMRPPYFTPKLAFDPLWGGGLLGFPKPQNRTKFGGKTEKPLKKSTKTEKPHFKFRMHSGKIKYTFNIDK